MGALLCSGIIIIISGVGVWLLEWSSLYPGGDLLRTVLLSIYLKKFTYTQSTAVDDAERQCAGDKTVDITRAVPSVPSSGSPLRDRVKESDADGVSGAEKTSRR